MIYFHYYFFVVIDLHQHHCFPCFLIKARDDLLLLLLLLPLLLNLLSFPNILYLSSESSELFIIFFDLVLSAISNTTNVSEICQWYIYPPIMLLLLFFFLFLLLFLLLSSSSYSSSSSSSSTTPGQEVQLIIPLPLLPGRKTTAIWPQQLLKHRALCSRLCLRSSMVLWRETRRSTGCHAGCHTGCHTGCQTMKDHERFVIAASVHSRQDKTSTSEKLNFSPASTCLQDLSICPWMTIGHHTRHSRHSSSLNRLKEKQNASEFHASARHLAIGQAMEAWALPNLQCCGAKFRLLTPERHLPGSVSREQWNLDGMSNMPESQHILEDQSSYVLTL